MPKTANQLRIKSIEKEINVAGTITQVDNVKPLCISARFECPACGKIINVLQMEIKFREPTRCGCGRKGRFRILSKEMIDSQIIYFGEKDKIPILLEKELTKNRLKTGDKIIVEGILKAKPYIYNRGPSRFNFYEIQANKIRKG